MLINYIPEQRARDRKLKLDRRTTIHAESDLNKIHPSYYSSSPFSVRLFPRERRQTCFSFPVSITQTPL